jgi:hypothetical protein
LKEDVLLPRVERMMKEHGYLSCRQVPLGTKRIDLVCYSPDYEEIIAIELKVSKWRLGLQQALSRRLCADRVYVAIPRDMVEHIDRQLFSRYGIGIIEVGRQARIVSDGNRSTSIQSSLRRAVIEYLQSNGGRS